MTTFLTIVVILTLLIAAYVLYGRAWLKSKPWSAGFFALIEPVEIALYRKSETVLWARFKMLIGLLLTFLTQIGSIDITPLMPLVPDEWEGTFRTLFGLIPLVITMVGWADEKLRVGTTKPIELVELPDVLPPKLAAVVEAAEVSKDKAVAVVEVAAAETKAETKAEGA